LLVGQPNLHDLLARPELEQLRQRVTVRYHLRPLDPGETAAYINHRLRKAAIGAPLVFSSEVTDLIGRASQGVPRKINVIADAVLLFGYGADKRVIDAALVREVIAELEATGVIPAVPAVPAMPGTVVNPPRPLKRRGGACDPRSATGRATSHPREQHRIIKLRESQIAAPPSPPASGRYLSRRRSRCLHRAQPLPAPLHCHHVSLDGPVPSPAVAYGFREPSSPGLWTRVRRGLFGVGKPVLED
jgi:hypothetical protein